MSWRLSARLAARDMRGGLRDFRIFLACLTLGVAAIAAVGSVRAGIEAGLKRDGAALLGGDAQLEYTYRFAEPNERQWMEGTAEAVSEVVDFRSMIVVERGEIREQALTQVKAVDSAYPLVGTVGLEPDMPLETALAGQNGLPGAVLDPLLTDRLGLEPGDRFRLGTQDFVVMAALRREPDNASGGFGLGPRSIVRTHDLNQSGLLEPGTLFSTLYRLDLPPNVDLEQIKSDVEQSFPQSGLRWSDARNGAPGAAEFVGRLAAFLVLVGLSGLAVGGVGVSAAVRAYVTKKTDTIATLRTLGADRATIFRIYFLQIGALSVIGTVIGLTLGGLAPLLFAPLIEAQLPIPAIFTLYPAPLFEAAIYGLLAALIFTLWPLARIEEVRAATLYRDAMASARALPSARHLVAIGLSLTALIGLAAYFSGSAELTFWTAGGLCGALAVLSLSAYLLRRLARALTPAARGKPAFRWALAAISGPREAAGSVILSLGLGLSVLASVGQIDGNLRNAIYGSLTDRAPAFFFVDLQKDQMNEFTDTLNNDHPVSKIESAPMLRGIITEINGRPAHETAGSHWVLEGDRGVTYSASLPPTHTLTEGQWWPSDYTGAPQVSFAEEEGREMGLKIGDTITVNILGRDITATVTSFREVDFSGAGIGFILSMNPRALSGAPHTFISTVYAEPEAEAAILRDIGQRFPNVTAIRVRDAIDRVSSILAGIAAATLYGAAATLLTGLLVLIGAAAAGETARTYEAAVLKTLGASRRRILGSFALRSALLGAAAGSVAIGAGITGGWAVSRFVFETDYAVVWPSAIAIVVGGSITTLGAGLLFALRPLAAKPARVLRTRE